MASKAEQIPIKLAVITLFPEMFTALTESGITARAVKEGRVAVQCWNPRDFARDKHRTVDDRPYGGGPGMLMKVQPLADAVAAARAWTGEARVIYLSPQGQRFTQQAAQSMAVQGDNLILIAGRYEGIDERLIESVVDEEWSIGDYVLSGGELPAMVLMDALIRLLPGALGDKQSAEEDSFSDGLLDYPHYTRPEVLDGARVPEVLLSGDHERIRRWRLQQALGRTLAEKARLVATQRLNRGTAGAVDGLSSGP